MTTGSDTWVLASSKHQPSTILSNSQIPQTYKTHKNENLNSDNEISIIEQQPAQALELSLKVLD